jgi:hypothetical protein
MGAFNSTGSSTDIVRRRHAGIAGDRGHAVELPVEIASPTAH